MTAMIELSEKEALPALQNHRRWMIQCGGTLKGYELHYGEAQGKSLYEADVASLRQLQRLANGGSVPAESRGCVPSRPDYSDVAEWFVCVAKDCEFIATSLGEMHAHDESHKLDTEGR